jgi:hypothetical protein
LDENGIISKEIARSSLTKHLVALAKEEEKDERALAASGFLHLISLTERPPRSTAFLTERYVPPASRPTFFLSSPDRPRGSKIPLGTRVMGSSGAALRSPIAHFRITDNKPVHDIGLTSRIGIAFRDTGHQNPPDARRRVLAARPSRRALPPIQENGLLERQLASIAQHAAPLCR